MNQIKCCKCKKSYMAEYEVCPFCGNIKKHKPPVAIKAIVFNTLFVLSTLVLCATVALFCLGYLKV